MAGLARWRFMLILLCLVANVATLIAAIRHVDEVKEVVPFFASVVALGFLAAAAAKGGSLWGLGVFWAALTWGLFWATLYAVYWAGKGILP